jgi:Tfp pilus assembly protein PilN
MNNTINLLIPEKHNPELIKRIKILRVISLSFLFIVVLVAISVFFLVLSSPLPKLRKEESAAVQQLSLLRSKSGKLFLLRERLSRIDNIVNKRQDFNHMIGKIQTTLPADVTIEHLKMNDGLLSVTVNSPSLLPINTFIANMTTLKSEDTLFSSLTLSNLAYDEENPIYKVTVTAKL